MHQLRGVEQYSITHGVLLRSLIKAGQAQQSLNKHKQGRAWMPLTKAVAATCRVPATVGIIGMTFVSQIDTPATLSTGSVGKGSASGSRTRPGKAAFIWLHLRQLVSDELISRTAICAERPGHDCNIRHQT
jgi:hypothetical protein